MMTSEQALRLLGTIHAGEDEQLLRDCITALHSGYEEMQREVDGMKRLHDAALPLWNHIGCAGCANWPNADCARQYERFVEELYRAVVRYNEENKDQGGTP